MASIDLHPHVVIKRSPIHGKGLFASKRIQKGELLGRIKGPRVTCDGPYVLWLDDRHGVHVMGELKFINHSNRPNACYYDDLTVMAIKTIKAGEEITHNYGEGWD